MEVKNEKHSLALPEIVSLASAFYGSSVLFSALEKQVFTWIARNGGTATLELLTTYTHSSSRGLRLLLDACVAVGVLEKDAAGAYHNTPAGQLALVSGAPADLSQAISYNRAVYPAWGKLSQLVETGAPVEEPAIHLGDDAERTRRFALSMRGRALAIGRSVIPMLDLSGCKSLLDLAGGPGTYAELMAQANPELHCVTVDLPAISAVAAECVEKAGMADRVECRPGDYHTDTYEENAYDAVTIFGALHQESPAQIVEILKRARRALRAGGKLFVLDMMTDATRAAPAFSALFAVNMALTTQNGWVFSDADLAGWMEVAGFAPAAARPLPPPMPHWLMQGVKR